MEATRIQKSKTQIHQPNQLNTEQTTTPNHLQKFHKELIYNHPPHHQIFKPPLNQRNPISKQDLDTKTEL
ncbi:hypothetical protein [Candidatus Phytoplasma tritici]|uniref:hypothetical protein n=1 Tax=Candidatus Phytoplasma tritici TaxID=321961 RepID=UPI00040C9070|nr:hypothetical protein [Candidatus Phytoplasma tritici]